MEHNPPSLQELKELVVSEIEPQKRGNRSVSPEELQDLALVTWLLSSKEQASPDQAEADPALSPAAEAVEPHQSVAIKAAEVAERFALAYPDDHPRKAKLLRQAEAYRAREGKAKAIAGPALR